MRSRPIGRVDLAKCRSLREPKSLASGLSVENAANIVALSYCLSFTRVENHSKPKGSRPKETKAKMRKSERAKIVQIRLENLYPTTPIPLDHKDTFTLLVSVLLSAQCTDKMVNRVTPSLWTLADNPHDMAKKTVESIRDIIKPCGLSPQKSKAIKELSAILVKEHAGQVPESFEALERLPGVGHKTASVVMSQGFGHPAFPVDTHIHRLAQRWGLTSGRSVVQTELDLKKLFDESIWNKLHLQIIFYGREHCSARGCDGNVCGICTELYPNRKKAVLTKK